MTEKAKRSNVLRAVALDRPPPEVAFIYAQTAQQMSMPGCGWTWRDIFNNARRFLVTTNVTTATATTDSRTYQTTTAKLATGSHPLVDDAHQSFCD